MSQGSRYEQRGVSSAKEDVHKAIAGLDKGLFPKAFCKIVPDQLTDSRRQQAFGARIVAVCIDKTFNDSDEFGRNPTRQGPQVHRNDGVIVDDGAVPIHDRVSFEVEAASGTDWKGMKLGWLRSTNGRSRKMPVALARR